MPSADDLKSFSRLSHSDASDNAKLTPKFPALPADVKARFPTMKAWEEKMNKEWNEKMTMAVKGGAV